jgi:hypothetical protein
MLGSSLVLAFSAAGALRLDLLDFLALRKFRLRLFDHEALQVRARDLQRISRSCA